jgi:hypothetical protein
MCYMTNCHVHARYKAETCPIAAYYAPVQLSTGGLRVPTTFFNKAGFKTVQKAAAFCRVLGKSCCKHNNN